MARTVHLYIAMKTRFRRFGSAGFSLVEMLIVVSLIGLMALVAWPKVAAVFNQSQLRSARLALLNKYNQARMIARQGSRRAILVRDGNILWVERTPPLVPNGASTRDTVGGYLNLAQYGVTLSGINSLAIDPRGISASGKIVLSRGVGGAAIQDSVVISGMGRVTR
jgi:prepilin-type N-terminal cleavage/methylation domain-containing protein